MESFILEYGVLAIAVIIFIDDLGVPLPGTTIVFSSAVIASQAPEINIWHLYLVALLIPPLGNMLLFYASRHGLRDWLDIHGHKVFLPQNRINKAQKIFDKYGEMAIFFAAMMTSVRTVSSVIAGGLKMNPLKFLLYHSLGVIIWASTVVGLGYFFGNEIWTILQVYWPILVILLALSIIVKFVYNIKNTNT